MHIIFVIIYSGSSTF